ncbi:MAG TPA: 4-hydroxy-3-methylbut-2-enyl diphosphate reductase [Opitutaceae bacterium]
MNDVSSNAPLVAILAFDASNRVAVRALGSKAGLAFTGTDLAMATARLESSFPIHTPPAEYFTHESGTRSHRVFFVQVSAAPRDTEIAFWSIERLTADPAAAPSLAGIARALDPYLAAIPYLHLGPNDFIYKFRPEKDRNPRSYQFDEVTSALYQSKLCAAIKAVTRGHERTATDPVSLDFGAVEYVIPSHFGFCLGVKNAIERAYETLAAHPGRRVFMLSELIHNPFVNEDLLRRGLSYLQSEKGVPFTVSGKKAATGTPDDPLLWDTLTSDDVVIIPAFGATDEDKARLVRKGIAVSPYDATCMLVEKVWKAARAYGREGFTVIIHGKSEHEETKATFSNARRYAPTVIVRNLAETRALGEIIASDDPRVRARFHDLFAGRFSPGFDVMRDLDRIAVVNQTTLLMNETLEIIEHLRGVYVNRYGAEEAERRVGGGAKRDTLCYATQVNQDALGRALQQPLDVAFIIGGKNSSNTYQLYRLCEQQLPGRAFFIQSEANIRSRQEVEHYVFPAAGPTHTGHIEVHPLWPADPTVKRRVLITGGASCPDGLIQQVVTRINGLWPAAQLRSIDEVLAELGAP